MPLKILLQKYVPDYNPLKGMNFYVNGEITVEELCERINIPCFPVTGWPLFPMEHRGHIVFLRTWINAYERYRFLRK
jgi:hypothetical protein